MPDVKEEVCGRKAGVFIKGNMRDLYSDGNVLYPDGINVNILLLWGLGKATRAVCTISYPRM